MITYAIILNYSYDYFIFIFIFFLFLGEIKLSINDGGKYLKNIYILYENIFVFNDTSYTSYFII